MNNYKFYNRKKELNFFNNLANTKQLIVMYGRRRIGKTELIKQFCRNKKSIYFFVETLDQKTLLHSFSNTIAEHKGYNIAFSNWDDFFKYILETFDFIVFDEFQNFARVNKALFSKIQNIWDNSKTNSGLILIGSYIGMMKKIFEDAKEPLFGRATNIINLSSFSFKNSYQMLNDFGYDLEQSIQIYAVLDGIPKYLWYCNKSMLARDKSDSIEKQDIYKLIDYLFLDDFAPLKEEGKNLLVAEFGTEHKGYFSILKAIGTHSKTQGQIVDISGLNKDKVGKYLFDLREVYNICEKQELVIGQKKKNNKYYIKDNFYKFWFEYIYSNYALVQIDSKKLLSIIKQNFGSYIGFVFEDISKQFLIENRPFKFEKIGRQWGKIPGTKETYEIDLVALNEQTKEIGFFECKWKNLNYKNALKILEELKEKSRFVDWNKEKRKEYFGLIAKKINGKNELRKQGFNVWDLWDFNKLWV